MVLGIEVLDIKSKCLLSKWLYKFLNEEIVCHELFQHKYLNSKTLSQVKAKALDSPFWKVLMKVNNDFFSKGFFKIGNGETLAFGKILTSEIHP
jgi:hypothetical protein